MWYLDSIRATDIHRHHRHRFANPYSPVGRHIQPGFSGTVSLERSQQAARAGAVVGYIQQAEGAVQAVVACAELVDGAAGEGVGGVKQTPEVRAAFVQVMGVPVVAVDQAQVWP